MTLAMGLIWVAFALVVQSQAHNILGLFVVMGLLSFFGVTMRSGLNQKVEKKS